MQQIANSFHHLCRLESVPSTYWSGRLPQHRCVMRKSCGTRARL